MYKQLTVLFNYAFIKLIMLSLLMIFIFFNLTSCKENEEKKKIIIFHAGSLSVPFKKIAKNYMQENPGIELILEASGSRQCARKIADMNKDCDIMASADYKVIENLLIPDYTNWHIQFARNEMAIVYHDKSRYADKISKDNWYNILLKDDVILGRSDPNSDPCGYRAVITSKLAEEYYREKGLAEKLLKKDKNYIRPKETDLIALLESNTIDYIFLYRSVAEQHSLNYIILNDSINLKNPALSDFYAQAKVKISGKKPGKFITKSGEAMVYGVTVLNNAPNREQAIDFLEYLLNKNYGMKIMNKCGQYSAIPSTSKYYENVPQELKKYVSNNQ